MFPLQATLLHRLSPEWDYLDNSLLRISGFVFCQIFCSYVTYKFFFFFAQQGWIIILTGLLVILFRHLHKSYCLEEWLGLCVLIRLEIHFLTIIHWWTFQSLSLFPIKSIRNMSAYKLSMRTMKTLLLFLQFFYSEFSYVILNSKVQKCEKY